MWLIGDIHGCATELQELLNILPKDEELIFLGDYIDRGPDSKGVVDLLLKEKDRSTFLIGNHEDMMLKSFQSVTAWEIPSNSSDRILWIRNGGRKSLDSYKTSHNPKAIPVDHWRFFNNLERYYENDDLIAVHASFEIGVPMEEQKEEVLIWERPDNFFLNFNHDKKIYYGHTLTWLIDPEGRAEPVEINQTVGLDTGCVFGGALSAYNHKTKEVLQVKNKTKERKSDK